MKPVDMLNIWSKKNHNVTGDCFRACLASLLELPIGDIPHVVQTANSEHKWWVGLVQNYLKQFDLWFCNFLIEEARYAAFVPQEGVLAIGTGRSPRRDDWTHSVIVRVSITEPPSLVHDPHPSRTGVTGGFREVGFLLRRFESTPEGR